MAGQLGKIIKANPELKPFPFPPWMRPDRCPPYSRKGKDYWRLENEKNEIRQLGVEKVQVKELAQCAAFEVKSGMWRLSVKTFTEAMLLLQKMGEDESRRPEIGDEMWSDISFSLSGAGFYRQALHVLGNMSSNSRADMERNVLERGMKKKRGKDPKLVAGMGVLELAKKAYGVIVPKPDDGWGPGLRDGWEDSAVIEQIRENGMQPTLTLQIGKKKEF